jgi:NADH-quinone oxidoreductase subunit L
MILIGAFEANSIFWIIAVIVSLMTTFYMFRLLYIVFWKRSNNEELHAHESPKNMTIPLMILAVLSVLAGGFGIPLVFGGNDIIGNFLSPIFAESTNIIKINAHEISHNTELLLMFIPVIFVFVVVYLAYYVYVKQKKLPEADNQKRPFFSNIFFKKLYFDEIYNALFVKPALWLSDFLHNIIELKVIDRMVNQAGNLVVWTGKTIRYIQTGNVGFYLFAMVISIILILIFKLFI